MLHLWCSNDVWLRFQLQPFRWSMSRDNGSNLPLDWTRMKLTGIMPFVPIRCSQRIPKCLSLQVRDSKATFFPPPPSKNYNLKPQMRPKTLGFATTHLSHRVHIFDSMLGRRWLSAEWEWEVCVLSTLFLTQISAWTIEWIFLTWVNRLTLLMYVW